MRPTFTFLNDTLIEQILDDAKRILSEIGMAVDGAALREQLLAQGLKTAKDGRILFPPETVDSAVAEAPPMFTLYDREGERYTQLGDERVHFVPGSSALRILDYRTQETRPANTSDFVDYVRLVDGLKHIAYLATAFSTDDIEEEVADAWRLFLCLTHSRKPIVSGAFTEHGVPRMAEMMQLFRHDRQDLRDRPMAIFTITPTGSFRYNEDSCQNLLDCLAWGIPIEITPVTLMGLIAPVTLLEAAAFHTADVLSGLTITQLIRPGAPVLFGGAPATFNMKTATSPMVAIEAQRLNLAYVAVAKYLGLPTQAYMALSDSKQLDAQAGAETFASALLAAMAGIHSVSGPGMLDFVMVFSLAKLLLDDDLCGQALHLMSDMTRQEGQTAVDLARELLEQGMLITADHTLTQWPDHLYLPGSVIDRQNRLKWEKAGRATLEERASAEVEQRIAGYTPPDTDVGIIHEMRRLIKAGMNNPAGLPPFGE